MVTALGEANNSAKPKGKVRRGIMTHENLQYNADVVLNHDNVVSSL